MAALQYMFLWECGVVEFAAEIKYCCALNYSNYNVNNDSNS